LGVVLVHVSRNVSDFKASMMVLVVSTVFQQLVHFYSIIIDDDFARVISSVVPGTLNNIIIIVIIPNRECSYLIIYKQEHRRVVTELLVTAPQVHVGQTGLIDSFVNGNYASVANSRRFFGVEDCGF